MVKNTVIDLLVSYSKNNKLPDVEWDSNSTIGMACDNIRKVSINNGCRVNKIYKSNSTNNTPISDHLTTNIEILDEVANKLAERISNSLSILHGMKRIVSTLTTEANKRKDKLLTSDPTTSKYLNKKNNAVISFNTVPWEHLSVVDSEAGILDYATEVLGFNPSENTYMATRIYSGKLPLYHTDKLYVDSPITSVEAKIRFSQQLQSVINLDKQHIDNAVDVICDKNKFTNIAKNISRIMTDTVSIENVIYALSFVKIFGSIVKEYSKQNLLLSDKSIANLNNNISIINEYVRGAAFYAEQHRRTTFANTLIFANRLVNGDNWDEYLENGGTKLDLEHHIQVMYGKFPIGNTGITINEVLDKRETVKNFTQLNDTQIQNTLTKKINEYTKSALESVVGSYFVNDAQMNKIVYDKNLADRISFHADNMLANKTSYEETIYSILFDIKYRDGFTKELYDKLELAFKDTVCSKKDVDVDDIAVAKAKVISDIVNDFMVKNFIKNN